MAWLAVGRSILHQSVLLSKVRLDNLLESIEDSHYLLTIIPFRNALEIG